jgi:hypothetical protein
MIRFVLESWHECLKAELIVEEIQLIPPFDLGVQ